MNISLRKALYWARRIGRQGPAKGSKNCPHCGSRPKAQKMRTVVNRHGQPIGCKVECGICFATGPVVFYRGYKQEDAKAFAVRRWRERV